MVLSSPKSMMTILVANKASLFLIYKQLIKLIFLFKGLRYKINNNIDKCEISELSTVNDAELSPAEFFKFDLDPPFQYVGQRRVRGINCDVWIAPRDRPDGNKTTYEW